MKGFVDIHCHGAFGIDFMSASEATMRELCDRLQEIGYRAVLPTSVTASCDEIEGFLDRLPDHPLIAGFHLEGPFISPTYPGAQPPQFICNPPEGPSRWDRILDDPRLRVITLAPELPNAPKLIERLSARGVIVSMGHTNATYLEAREGEQAGAHHVTHMFNAMRPLHHREAGTVGYALTSDSLTCELIYDRHHVCREAAALLIKNKPIDKLIAVSDATMAAGLPSGQDLEMWGLKARTEDGTVRLLDGTLAGSAITLADAFRNLSEDFGVAVAAAMCVENPARALKLSD
jgi:N-acetylglucosamine-6-phosphate deacetylase